MSEEWGLRVSQHDARQPPGEDEEDEGGGSHCGKEDD